MGEVSRLVVYLFMIGMLISGTLNTIFTKGMDILGFKHPYFQCMSMFFGEFLCLSYYFAIVTVRKRNKQADHESLIPENQPPRTGLHAKVGDMIFAIPAFFDLCASTLNMIGLVLSAASVYQMLRGFVIVVVAVYSVIFLKRTLYRHQITGVILTIAGITLVGMASVLYKASTAENPFVGVLVLLASQFFAGGVWVIEEKFLSDIVIDPMKVVGIEGLSGLAYFALILPILNLIPCTNDSFCSHGYVENSINAFKELGNAELLFLMLGSLFALSMLNWTGVSTTKYGSALARSTIDTSRTLLVWIVDIIVGWETFIPLQLAGFLLLTTGTILYNEIYVPPILGFKEAMAKHQEDVERRKNPQKVETASEETDYIGFKPQNGVRSSKLEEVDTDV